MNGSERAEARSARCRQRSIPHHRERSFFKKNERLLLLEAWAVKKRTFQIQEPYPDLNFSRFFFGQLGGSDELRMQHVVSGPGPAPVCPTALPLPAHGGGSDALLKTTEVIRSCIRHAGRTFVAPNCTGFGAKHCKDCITVPKAPRIPGDPGSSSAPQLGARRAMRLATSSREMNRKQKRPSLKGWTFRKRICFSTGPIFAALASSAFPASPVRRSR